MQILTVDEIKQLEKETFLELGLPSLLIMENAGRAVAEVVLRQFHDNSAKNILVVCGSGNNGGDGFVAARTLHNLGHAVTVFCTKQTEHLSNDARFQAGAFKNVGGTIYSFPECSDWENIFADKISQSDLIIDALLGIGFKKAYDMSDVAPVIEMINTATCPVVAVDLASGINADTGEISAQTVKAAITVTFQYPKLGQLLMPAMAYTGELYVCDIGLVAKNTGQHKTRRELLTPNVGRTLLSVRRGPGGAVEDTTPILLCEDILKQPSPKESISQTFIDANKQKLPIIIDEAVLATVVKDAALKSMLPENSVAILSGAAAANLLNVQGAGTDFSHIECASILSRALNMVVILKDGRSIVANSEGFIGVGGHVGANYYSPGAGRRANNNSPLQDTALQASLSDLIAKGYNLTDAACISLYSVVNKQKQQESRGGKELIQKVNV